jgi:hypothetical protein
MREIQLELNKKGHLEEGFSHRIKGKHPGSSISENCGSLSLPPSPLPSLLFSPFLRLSSKAKNMATALLLCIWSWEKEALSLFLVSLRKSPGEEFD